ncbi:MAG: PepSY domain-containing protein [Gammaproteobacteria bacterium]|nr:PepSY domain-containing protein [Gammaproteobacteria bacterium]
MFQIHLWAGLGLGLWLAVVSVTGVMLVFKDESLALAYPNLYRAAKTGAPTVSIDTIVDLVTSKYPRHNFRRIDVPTPGRDTYLIMALHAGAYRQIFAHPDTGAVLGQLPKPSFISIVEEVHGNLLAGGPGRIIDCTLALLALLLISAGVIIWWPGAKRWWKALGLKVNRGGTTIRALHGTIGIWTFAFIAMFAATGSLYYFSPVVYRGLARVSQLSDMPVHYSNPNLNGAKPRPDIQSLIDGAQQGSPDRKLWGVFLPMSEKGAIRVVLGPVGKEIGRDRWEWNDSGQRNFYFDQYSGELLHQWDTTNNTLADFVRSWWVKLHTGDFGGVGVKTLWALTGLAPVALFVLGVMMWWKRVVRPERAGLLRDGQ